MAEDKKAATPPAKKKVIRSPKYPSISLADAIAKARLVYDAENKIPTSEDVIREHLGYNSWTGPAGRTVSALKQYGLLVERDGGLFSISDPCFRYFELPEENPERQEILKKFAYSPVLFKELLEKYKETGLPSDPSLRSYLVIDKGFNAGTVADFIRAFRATIELAKPLEGGYTPTDAGGKPEGQSKPAGGKPMQEANLRSPNAQELGQIFKHPPLPPLQGKELRFNISRDSEAQVIFSGPVTQEAIDKLAKLLELQKDTFPTKDELERPQPRMAVWRNKDHDQPVTITGELGEKDGKRFYAAKETATGIPENELVFEDAQAKGSS